MGETKRDESEIVKKVGNLVAASAIASMSPSLMDRLSHALSPNIVLETVYECQRIYNSGIRSGDIIIGNEKVSGEDKDSPKSYSQIFVKTEFQDKESRIRINNYIPDGQDINDLIEYLKSDRDLGKKIAVYALTVVNRNYTKIEAEMENGNKKEEVIQ